MKIVDKLFGSFNSLLYLYGIRVEGILQLKQTLRWGYKVNQQQTKWKTQQYNLKSYYKPKLS